MIPVERKKALDTMIDKPYEYGARDCLQVVLTALGDTAPREFRDVSVENYVEAFDDPQEACEFLAEAIRHYCRQVPAPAYGDLVIIELVGLVGVYVGNGHFMTALVDKGVKVLPLLKGATFWRLRDG